MAWAYIYPERVIRFLYQSVPCITSAGFSKCVCVGNLQMPDALQHAAPGTRFSQALSRPLVYLYRHKILEIHGDSLLNRFSSSRGRPSRRWVDQLRQDNYFPADLSTASRHREIDAILSAAAVHSDYALTATTTTILKSWCENRNKFN